MQQKNFDVRVARILWKLVIHFPRIAPDSYRHTTSLQASNKHMVNFELFEASFNESSKSPILGARPSS